MDLSIEVADELRADAQMSFDNTNDAVWGLVTNWIESHKDIVQKLWQKKSSYNTDPSEYDIHVVKRHVLPLFLKKFGKKKTGFGESLLRDKMESKILKEMRNYDSHNLERFCKNIIEEVTHGLQQDSGMSDWDAGTKIWEFVNNWVERHPRFMRELWWETHDRPNDNPTKE